MGSDRRRGRESILGGFGEGGGVESVSLSMSIYSKSRWTLVMLDWEGSAGGSWRTSRDINHYGEHAIAHSQQADDI